MKSLLFETLFSSIPTYDSEHAQFVASCLGQSTENPLSFLDEYLSQHISLPSPTTLPASTFPLPQTGSASTTSSPLNLSHVTDRQLFKDKPMNTDRITAVKETEKQDTASSRSSSSRKRDRRLLPELQINLSDLPQWQRDYERITSLSRPVSPSSQAQDTPSPTSASSLNPFGDDISPSTGDDEANLSSPLSCSSVNWPIPPMQDGSSTQPRSHLSLGSDQANTQLSASSPSTDERMAFLGLPSPEAKVWKTHKLKRKRKVELNKLESNELEALMAKITERKEEIASMYIGQKRLVYDGQVRRRKSAKAYDGMVLKFHM